MSSTYDRRREAGLCPICGNKPPEGSVVCMDCRQRKSRNYYNLKNRGICVVCKWDKAQDNEAMCQRCREMTREKRKSLYKMRVQNGRCTRCGETVDDKDYLTCKRCRDRGRGHPLKWGQP